MSKTAFRFDGLLTLRRQERAQRRMHLASLLAQQHELEARRTAIEEALAAGRRGEDRAAPGRVDVARLAAAARYEARLRGDLSKLAERQEAMAREIDDRRAAVVEADREVQKLEKLRDHRDDRLRIAQTRAEARLLDERSAGGIIRRGRLG